MHNNYHWLCILNGGYCIMFTLVLLNGIIEALTPDLKASSIWDADVFFGSFFPLVDDWL